MAMDALRNMVIQAFLIDKEELVKMILGNGFFALIEQIIRKAIDQLQVESQLVQSQQKNSKDSKQTEHYQLSIEQAYVCLADVCHFLEHGEVLKSLSQSELVTKTVRLALNCAALGNILTVKIFKQLSLFLRELSNDNDFVKGLVNEEFDAFLKAFPVTDENQDFYWNLLEFHFNVALQKEGQIGIQQRMQFYFGQFDSMLVPQKDPVTQFKEHFLDKYKLAATFAGQKPEADTNQEAVDMEESKDDGGEERTILVEGDEEDEVAKNNPTFTRWRHGLQA